MYKKLVARYQNKEKLIDVLVIETNILIKKMYVVEIYIAGRKSDIGNTISKDFYTANEYAKRVINQYK